LWDCFLECRFVTASWTSTDTPNVQPLGPGRHKVQDCRPRLLLTVTSMKLVHYEVYLSGKTLYLWLIQPSNSLRTPASFATSLSILGVGPPRSLPLIDANKKHQGHNVNLISLWKVQ
jgi:hypothetical protein